MCWASFLNPAYIAVLAWSARPRWPALRIRSRTRHMNIDPTSQIADTPALKIRGMLRKWFGAARNERFVAQELSLTNQEAIAVIEELCRLGYIELETNYPHGPWWRTTVKGNALALASAARPLRRANAERTLSEFLVRVRAVNANPYYLYAVCKVLLFGSMLTDAERVNDVDVAVDLIHKIRDRDKRMQADQERARMAEDGGRRFGNFVERLFWPKYEVILFLKSRSRTLSIHEADDAVLESASCRIIFEEPESTTTNV
jgi:hypothetical protein